MAAYSTECRSCERERKEKELADLHAKGFPKIKKNGKYIEPHQTLSL